MSGVRFVNLIRLRAEGWRLEAGGWRDVTACGSPLRNPHSAFRIPHSALGVFLLATLLLTSPATSAHAFWPFNNASTPAVPQQPHPAVVRVTVPERDGTAFGSGTLVDVNGEYGLVVTNWHVIRDAAGPIQVTFPDGFRSAAAVVKWDKDWDLAALAIWRPEVSPVALARQAPRRGEPLSIAGYGKGNYRAVGGRCTQYVSPGKEFPPEMVELSVMARQGDSGGPIFNQQGELAGVLFGAGGGTTAGSYSGRVQTFLASVVPGTEDAGPLRDVPSRGADRIAALPQEPDDSWGIFFDEPESWSDPAPEKSSSLAAAARDETAQELGVTESRTTETWRQLDPVPSYTHPGVTRPEDEAAAAVEEFSFVSLVGSSPLDLAKTALALLGLFALLMHTSRVLQAE